MRAKLFLFILSCCLFAGILSGCGANENPYKLTADNITGVWMETLPAKSDSPKYTDDTEMIQTVVDYINGLKLRQRTEKGEDISGMAMRIELSYSDGTVREFWHSGNLYFTETAADSKQYLMEYEQAGTFESDIYNKMQSAPLIKGIVEEVSEGENNYKALLVSVDPSTQSLAGDKTILSVKTDRVFNGSQSNAEISIGDTIEFYVNGGVNESYPTQCGAWKAMLLSKAEATNDVLNSQPADLPTEDSNPYFVLFKQLYADDPGLNGDIKYIAVDLTDVKSEDNADFLVLIEAFCKKDGFTLLVDTMDGLNEKGYIKNLSLEEGIVIAFEDTSLTDTKLVTQGRKWRSGDGAIGGTFTLEKKNGTWSITKTENQWIS